MFRNSGLSLAETASRSVTSLFSLTDRVSPRLRGFKVWWYLRRSERSFRFGVVHLLQHFYKYLHGKKLMTYILWLLICCYMSWATFHAMLELLFGIPECQSVAPCYEILELWTFKKWWLTWCDVTGLVLEILCICTFTSLIRSQEWSSSKTSLRRSETSSATGEDIFYDCGEVIKNKIMCLNSLLIGLWKCCHWNGPCWNKNKQKVK